ncbi:cyclin-like protein, putative [Bodo saltans]|uniref:Cyclin-like protein, putative n=1 Tax=Bodo saltans TaxID=75058 RepID=A0A0S4ITB1_BODSA|nr:cyclin-like protein, putative [Bodo saltans]|eukprot:CUF14622.1 cyclin-like protein, putative [Bodo saltans]
MLSTTPPSPLFASMKPHAALIQHDADRRVSVRHLCSILLSTWTVTPKRSQPNASDSTFVQYTYDATLFERDPFFGGPITAHVPLHEYVQRQLCYGTSLPFPCAVLALRLIDGYHKSTLGCVNYSNAHLLFAVALMIATKAHCDEVVPWSYTQQVVGIASSLLSNLEVIVLFENRMNIIPSVEQYVQFRSMIVVDAIPVRMHLSSFCEVDSKLCSCEELHSYELACLTSTGGLSDDAANTPQQASLTTSITRGGHLASPILQKCGGSCSAFPSTPHCVRLVAV